MFIVVAADIGIVLDILDLSKEISTAMTILRALRILRVVRIFGKMKTFKVIVLAIF